MNIALLKLWWLLVIPPAIWFAYGYFDRERSEQLSKLGSSDVLKKVVSGPKYGQVSRRLFILGVFFIVLALLRPQWGVKQEQFTQKGLDLVIAIDTSASMYTPDIFPSRIEKTVQEVSRIMDNLTGDRVGIVTFANSATIVAPLTVDYDAVKLFLTTVIGARENVPGTSIHAAVAKSLEAFEANVPQDKVLVLFTDGEDHEGGLDGLKNMAADKGVAILPVCVGTEGGQPIPLLDDNGQVSGYKKDKKGNVVVSRIHPENLQPLASSKVYLLNQNSDPLADILQDIQYFKRVGLKNNVSTIYSERFQIFLLLSIIFIALSFIL